MIPLSQTLKPGTGVHLEPAGGRSSSDFLPFFNVENAPHGGVVLGLGWSSEWAAHFLQEDARRTRLQAGMALAHLRLHPGEEIRTPRVALLFYDGDWIRGQNLWRRFVLRLRTPFPIRLPAADPDDRRTPNTDVRTLNESRSLLKHPIRFQVRRSVFGVRPSPGTRLPRKLDPTR